MVRDIKSGLTAQRWQGKGLNDPEHNDSTKNSGV